MRRSFILGIDPGLQHTGWCIIDAFTNQLSFVVSGTIHTSSNDSLPSRIQQLAADMQSIKAQHSIDVVAMEKTFLNVNPESSLKLGHARGALMASLKGFQIHEYAATAIKKTITGNGRAEKSQVNFMIKRLLPRSNCRNADEVDAAAVAICHAYQTL